MVTILHGEKEKPEKSHLVNCHRLKAIDKIVLNSRAKIYGPIMVPISFVKFN
jgi:hypothetical protein